jgi:hypothetical protein
VQNTRVTRYLIDEEEVNMEPKVAVLPDAAHLLGSTTFLRAMSAAALATKLTSPVYEGLTVRFDARFDSCIYCLSSLHIRAGVYRVVYIGHCTLIL